MTMWNYVVTAHKPTIVAHSCVGNFTGPEELNLVTAKCTRIEIHLFTPQGLQLMLDAPIYGRIAILELFRRPDQIRDSLLVVTEKYDLCVLEWDVKASDLIKREMVGLSDPRPHCRAVYGQIGIIDPDCRVIGLYLYEGVFKVIPLYKKGKLIKDIRYERIEDLQVLDIKFLYGCSNPTIVVLYQDNEDTRHVKTYEFTRRKGLVEGHWSRKNLDNGANLLISVPPPLCGFLIIGEQTIVYCSANSFRAIPIGPSIIITYGRVDADGSRYLLGDHAGHLHLLAITSEKERVTGLHIELLGETSIASTISYLDNGFVFVGSSFGDSQLIKLNLEPDAKGSYVEVLENYVNLGPIVDFCVVDLERQGQGQLITCSGAYKDGSLRIVRNGIGINEQASVELQGIKRIWSLRSSTFNPYDPFLVLSFIGETRILAMNLLNELEETEIKGFCCQAQTLFCHYAVHNQLVQVTSSSVRLVSSTTRELQNEWSAPSHHSINLATANATQVLLATGGGHLVYLEIGDGMVIPVQHVRLEYEISCLDINPIGENPNYSQLAAVGTWTDMAVRVFSLPVLNIITKEHLGGETIPRSVLLSTFERIPYLLCALGDGHLLIFLLNLSTGELTDRKKVSLGTCPITLGTFASKDTTYVFAASDRPKVIYSRNKKLRYSNVNLDEVGHMCSFNSAAFPDSVAIAKSSELTIGTIDEIRKFHSRPIPLGEHARRICHQEQSRTFAVCSVKNSINSSAEGYEMHFIRLLDDQTFEFISTYSLDISEHGCSILSCSFSDDSSEYYCIGTGYTLPEENEPTKGRILVFLVEYGTLKLIAEKQTDGAVYSLSAFHGKLLAATNQKIQLYKWMLLDDGTHELQSECGHNAQILYVQTRGDLIVVGHLKNSISLLTYMHEGGTLEERARNDDAIWMSAVEILDDDIYLGAEINFNLFTVRKKSDEDQGRLDVVGVYHLGEFVNRFRHGSLVIPSSDSDSGQIPTVIFGTVSGAIGVIASLPIEQYLFLEKLQANLRKVIKGVGGLNHQDWRSFDNEWKTVDAKNFVDGDLIESFLDLSRRRMGEISKEMGVSIQELCQRVEELKRLH